MSLRSLLELDARFSGQLRVAEKPGILRNVAVFFAHSGDSWFWGAALVLSWFFSNSAWKQWEVVEFFGIAGLAGRKENTFHLLLFSCGVCIQHPG